MRFKCRPERRGQAFPGTFEPSKFAEHNKVTPGGNVSPHRFGRAECTAGFELTDGRSRPEVTEYRELLAGFDIPQVSRAAETVGKPMALGNNAGQANAVPP